VVQSLLSASAITPINLAEVAKKLRERDVPTEDIRATVWDLRVPLECARFMCGSIVAWGFGVVGSDLGRVGGSGLRGLGLGAGNLLGLVVNGVGAGALVGWGRVPWGLR